MNFEHKILLAIASTRNNLMTAILKACSKSANGGAIFIFFSAIMLFTEKYRKMGIYCIVAVLTHSVICNVILKLIIRRMRPFDRYSDITVILDKLPKDYSFPSGHTGASFAFAMTIFLYNKKLGIIAYIFAIMVAYSRMYLGVHYPTDIVGGIIVGTVVSVLAKKFFNF